MKIKNKSLMAALAVLATFLWGSAFPSVKLGYEIFKIQGDDIGSKLLFAGIRFAAAGLMVLAVLGVQTRQRPLPKKGAFKHLLTLGILQTTIQYYFFYVGLAHTTGAKGSIINSFTAFFPVVLAPFFFKSDRLTAKKIIGMCRRTFRHRPDQSERRESRRICLEWRRIHCAGSTVTESRIHLQQETGTDDECDADRRISASAWRKPAFDFWICGKRNFDIPNKRTDPASFTWLSFLLLHSASGPGFYPIIRSVPFPSIIC